MYFYIFVGLQRHFKYRFPTISGVSYIRYFQSCYIYNHENKQKHSPRICSLGMIGYTVVTTSLAHSCVCISAHSGLEWAAHPPQPPLGYASWFWSLLASIFIPMSSFQSSLPFPPLLLAVLPVFLVPLSLYQSHNSSSPFIFPPHQSLQN